MTLGTTVLAAALAPVALLLGSIAGVSDFEEIDTDGDGRLTRGEFAAAYPDANSAVFLAVDSDGDGALSEAEHAAASDAGLLRRDG